MKNLPLAFKIIINIFFYIVYTIIGHIIFAFVFVFILKILGKGIPISTDPVFIKIGIVASFFVLAITLIFRRYFYIGLEEENNHKEKDEYKKLKKDINNKKETKKTKDNDSMKIYIEKEINK